MRKHLIILILLLFWVNVLIGQPIELFNTPGDPPIPEPIPLDGGLLYLLAGGVLIGIKKFKDLKSKK